MLADENFNFKQIAQGNQKAFDDLFRSHYKYLVTIAYGYTKDYNKSKDLAQEVFLDIWKRREKIEIKTSLRGFLRRAVINQALSANKKNKHDSEISNEAMHVSTDADAHRNVEMNELNQKIQSIVESMPDRCREIFKLSRFENLSHKEISAKLNISVKTIENQITKALKMLRKGLKEDHFISWLVILTFLN